MVKKLSPRQAELLEAMKNGVVCRWMSWNSSKNPYYFRNDTMASCTATAEALLKRGLVKITDKDWRGHKLVYKEPTDDKNDGI